MKKSALIDFIISSLNLKSTMSTATKAAMLSSNVNLKLPVFAFFN